jgi:adenosine deaminase
MSKDLYISTILAAISAHNATSVKMKTYLILSIDRRNTLEEAMTTANLAIEYSSQGVIGVDLCGDSLCGDISIFAPAFQKVRDAGLKITLHFGEEPSNKDELMTLLSYQPNRLGHLIWVSEEAKAEVVRRKLPIELCLTSNIKGPYVSTYEEHHLAEWMKEGVPIALCTDNVGVVESPGSKEYEIAARAFGLGYQQLWDIAFGGIDGTFAGEERKEELRSLFLQWKGDQGRVWFEGV